MELCLGLELELTAPCKRDSFALPCNCPAYHHHGGVGLRARAASINVRHIFPSISVSPGPHYWTFFLAYPVCING